MPAEAIEIDSTRHWRPSDLLEVANERHRYEISDGMLEVTPTPSAPHMSAVTRLHRIIDRQLQETLACGVDLGITIGDSYRVPDIAVIQARALDHTGHSYASADFLLIGEVVSPSSRANDRFVKRVEYATAKIPLYMRIEVDEAAIVVDVLDAGRGEYRQTGTYHRGETIELAQPVQLRIAVDDVLG